MYKNRFDMVPLWMRLLVKIYKFPEINIHKWTFSEKMTYSGVMNTLSFLEKSGYCQKRLNGRSLDIKLTEKGERAAKLLDQLISSLLPD